MRIQDVAQWLSSRSGWARAGVAWLAGALSVLAMAPFHIWPVLLLTFPILVWQIDGIAVRGKGRAERRSSVVRAGMIGWRFGFGYFFAGLFWIGEAFLVEAETFAFLLPVAITVLPAGLALFWSAATALAARFWPVGLTRVVLLAITLGAAEWLRGHVLTGFPWNVLGYALTYPDALLQSVGVLGIYALSVLAVLLLALPLVAWAEGRPRRGLAISLSVLSALLVYGRWQLSEPLASAARPTHVRLVQPSIPQSEKWQAPYQRRIFDLHLSLSTRNKAGREDGAAGRDLIIWPEAAMPFLPLDTPEALQQIGRMLPEGSHLISGALRADPPDETRPEVRRRVFNSLMAFGDDGRAVTIYDKIHLVPFGEYLPLGSWLDAIGLEPLTRRRGGFTSGPRPRTLMALPRVPSFAPLICYEAIFPGALIQGTERPAFLLNVTNDGWFGNTTGPRQHLHQARVRAVEEGLPLLRVANNGITAVVDARGRVLQQLDMNVVGVIDATVPAAAPAPLYTRWGDTFFLLMLLCGAAVVFGPRLLHARARTISKTRDRG